jgi:hypothetical protein
MCRLSNGNNGFVADRPSYWHQLSKIECGAWRAIVKAKRDMLSGVEAGLSKHEADPGRIIPLRSAAIEPARVMISERHQRCADSIGCYGG